MSILRDSLILLGTLIVVPLIAIGVSAIVSRFDKEE